MHSNYTFCRSTAKTVGKIMSDKSKISGESTPKEGTQNSIIKARTQWIFSGRKSVEKHRGLEVLNLAVSTAVKNGRLTNKYGESQGNKVNKMRKTSSGKQKLNRSTFLQFLVEIEWINLKLCCNNNVYFVPTGHVGCHKCYPTFVTLDPWHIGDFQE